MLIKTNPKLLYFQVNFDLILCNWLIEGGNKKSFKINQIKQKEEIEMDKNDFYSDSIAD